MKGELTLKALQIAEEAAGNFFDNVEAFLTAGYGASVWQLEKERSRHRRERLEAEERQRRERQLRNLIYRLKKEGLVKEEKTKQGLFYFLTKAGREKKKELEEQLAKGALPSISKYKKETEGGGLKIVTFDIPELKRHIRIWLRAVLLVMGFSKLQQSVWIGKAKIPEVFIHDLEKMEIRRCVHIFSINRKGTIENF